MKIRFFENRKFLNSFISLFLVASFLVIPLSETLQVKKVAASTDSVFVLGGNGTVQETITAVKTAVSAISDAATAASTGSLVTKEYILDTIVWPLTNIVIKEMIRSTTKWVNSGFQGSPA